MPLVLMGVGTGGLVVLDMDAINEPSVAQVKSEEVVTSVNHLIQYAVLFGIRG